MTIKTKRAEYKKKFGTNPFYGWDEAELQKRIDEHVAKEAEPAEEKAETPPVAPTSEKKEYPMPTNPLDEPIAIHIEGEPFCIIGNEYVPWNEAQKQFLKAKIKYYQIKLDELEK